MEHTGRAHPTIRFGVFEVDPCSGELRKAGTRIRLQDQPFKVLLALLEHPGEVVTREELQRRIWPEASFGDFDHAVNVAVAKLRAALADCADTPRFVETLPRRGYRFIFPVTSPSKVTADVTSVQAHEPLKTGKKTREFPRTAITAAMIVGGGLAVFGFWFSSRKPHPLGEKDTIVLADFTNTTGDPVFDETLRQGLSVQLEQSPFLNIVSDQRIQQTLQMMGQKPDIKLTPGITREVCQRTSGAATLDGSIAQVGTQYLLILKAINCSNGELMASVQAEVSDKNHVLGALGKTASEIRNKLGESVTSIQQFDAPMEQVTTSSLEALKTFSIFSRGVTPGYPMLQHAIELDPNFALAYSQMSDLYTSVGDTELASEYAQKAYDRRQRVSERERLNITATFYFATLGDLDRELLVYPIWEHLYPREAGPWVDSSSTHEILGNYALALDEAQEAVRLAPHTYTCYTNVDSALLSLHRLDEAKQVAQRALAQGLEMPDFHLFLYQVAFLENDTKEMDAQLATFSGRSGSDARVALYAQSSTEAYFGRLSHSLEFSRRALETVRGKLNEVPSLIQDTDALREVEFGYPGKARRTAATALTPSSGRSAKLFTALALARAGDVTHAQAMADELNRQFPSHTLLQRYWLPTIRGAMQLARKNPAKALDALRDVSYELGDVGFPAGNLYPVYIRGQAYLGTRQGKEAAAEFQKFLDHRSIVLNSPLGALAQIGLARAYALQGDRVKAIRAYQDFLTLWKDADPDIPILKQAKAEYARLQ